jgi:hypothetical protein
MNLDNRLVWNSPSQQLAGFFGCPHLRIVLSSDRFLIRISSNDIHVASGAQHESFSLEQGQ